MFQLAFKVTQIKRISTDLIIFFVEIHVIRGKKHIYNADILQKPLLKQI